MQKLSVIYQLAEVPVFVTWMTKTSIAVDYNNMYVRNDRHGEAKYQMSKKSFYFSFFSLQCLFYKFCCQLKIHTECFSK